PRSSSSPSAKRSNQPSMRFRKIKIALALAAAVVAVAVLAAWLLLRSASFHRYLLHVAQQQASASLGNQVRIGAFALHAHGFTPRLDAYNLTIAGAPPFQDRPLLAIPHLHVVITIASLLHRQWFLSDLELDRPQIHVIMDADGRSNLPKGNGKGRGGTSLWALGIRHAVVRGGMVQVQDQTAPLDADLQAVHLEARFNPALQQYTGEFGYQSGLLRLDAYNPIPHALSLQFAATPRGLEAPSIHLASQATRLDASLSLQDWSHPRLSGRFTLALDAAQARQITRIAAIPTGQVALAGQYQFTAPRDLIVSGGFSSRELQVTVGTVRAPVRALRGQFKFANDDLSVDAIHGSALGGTFSADFLWRNLGQPRAPASFHAQLDRAQIQTLLPDSAKLGVCPRRLDGSPSSRHHRCGHLRSGRRRLDPRQRRCQSGIPPGARFAHHPPKLVPHAAFLVLGCIASFRIAAFGLLDRPRRAQHPR